MSTKTYAQLTTQADVQDTDLFAVWRSSPLKTVTALILKAYCQGGVILADGSVPFTGALQAFAGTIDTPGMNFDGDENTGLYRKANGTIGLVSNGVEVGSISGDAMTLLKALVIAPESDIASAATCDLSSVASNSVRITGTTNITSFGTGTYQLKFGRFAGSLKVTHNASSLILPGARNIVTQAGDQFVATSDGSGNWRVMVWQQNARRQICTTNLQLYVRTDGSDSNDGLSNSAAGAFLTLQAAVNCVYRSYDLAGYYAQINVIDGVYAAGAVIYGDPVGGGTLHPLRVVGQSTSTYFLVTGANIFENYGGHVLLDTMRLQTLASGSAIIGNGAGTTAYQGILFGNCAAEHLLALLGHNFVALGNYEIGGGGTLHAHITTGSFWNLGSITITTSGTPDFSQEFMGVNWARVTFSGTTFVGSGATGVRHLVHYNSYIETGGQNPATYLPGNAPGTVDAATFSTWT